MSTDIDFEVQSELSDELSSVSYTDMDDDSFDNTSLEDSSQEETASETEGTDEDEDDDWMSLGTEVDGSEEEEVSDPEYVNSVASLSYVSSDSSVNPTSVSSLSFIYSLSSVSSISSASSVSSVSFASTFSSASSVSLFSSISGAPFEVETELHMGAKEVISVRDALIQGDQETNRPPLPIDIVTKILDMSEHWCCVEKKICNVFEEPLDQEEHCIFKFGPIQGRVKKVKLRLCTSCYTEDDVPSQMFNPQSSQGWAEIDVVSSLGNSKLSARQPVFSHNSPVPHFCLFHSQTFLEHEYFLNRCQQGDELKFYIKELDSEYSFTVENGSMILYYEPPFIA